MKVASIKDKKSHAYTGKICIREVLTPEAYISTILYGWVAHMLVCDDIATAYGIGEFM